MSFQLRDINSGEIHPLQEKRMSIGSADKSNIVLKDPDVSPTQCFLSKTKLGYFLMNFNPEHVITINDEQVKEKMLKVGDQLHIGSFTFVLEELGAAPEGDVGEPAQTEADAPPAGDQASSAEAPPTDTPDAETATPEPAAPVEAPAAEEKQDEPQPAPPAGEPEPEPAIQAPEPEPAAPEPEVQPGPEPEDPAPQPEVQPEPAPETPAPEPEPEPVEDQPAPAPWEVSPDAAPAAAEDKPELMPEEAGPDEDAPTIVGETPPSPADIPPVPETLESAAHKEQAAAPDTAAPADSAPEPGAEAGAPADDTAMAPSDWSLKAMYGELEGKFFPVSGLITVGSNPKNTICITDAEVGAFHGELELEHGELWVRRLGSNLKISVNGEEVDKAILANGDVLEIGDALLQVNGPEVKTVVPAEIAASAPAPWEIDPGVPQETAPGPEPEAMSPEEVQAMLGTAPADAATSGETAPEPPPAQEGPARFILRIHGGKRDGDEVPVTKTITVGRTDENDIVLLSKAVSRRHAEFAPDGDGLTIRDLGSSSGVKVNGARVKEDILTAGDQVELGDIIFLVKTATSQGEPAAQAPASTPEPAEEPAAEPAAVAAPAPPKPSAASHAASKPIVMVMGGSLDGKIIPIAGTVVIGSHGDCGMAFTDAGVAPRHAELHEAEGVLTIKPLDGSVQVNGTPLTGTETLSKGDAVEIDQILIIVRETATPAAAPAPPAEPPAAAPSGKPSETPGMGIAPLALDEEKKAGGAADEPAKFTLLVRGGLMDGKSFPVTDEVTVGRESDNTIVLLDTAVSRRHARVFFEGSDLRIEDAGSTGGVWVNGKKIESSPLSHGDLVRVGHTEIQVRDANYDLLPAGEKPPLPSAMNAVKHSPAETPSADAHVLTVLKGEDQGCHYEIRGNVSFGRHKSCDVVINHEEASGRHAEFTIDGKRPILTDLESTNGTRLNGTRIKKRYVFHGDVLEMGYTEFHYREPNQAAPSKPTRRPSLVVSKPGQDKPDKYRLGAYTLIGRNDLNSIHLVDQEASGEHAAVIEKNRAFFVRDLGSTNGTRLNGTRLTGEAPLQHGDRIQIGSFTLSFKEHDKPLPQASGGGMLKSLALAAVLLIVVAGAVGAFLFKDQLFPPGPGTNGNGPGPGTPGETGENIVQNGSFENGADQWQAVEGDVSVVEEDAKDGAKCLRLGGSATESTGVDAVVSSAFNKPVDSTYYRLSGHIRTKGSGGLAGLRLRWTRSDGTAIESLPDSYTNLITDSDGAWEEVSGLFKVPETPVGVSSLNLGLDIVAAGNTGPIWVDDVRLEKVSTPDGDLRDRPRIVLDDSYSVRAGDSGVFSVWYQGSPRPFATGGRLTLERLSGRNVDQTLSSVLEGPSRSTTGGYSLRGMLLDFETGETMTFRQYIESNGEDIEVRYQLENRFADPALFACIPLRLSDGEKQFKLFDEAKRTWEPEGEFKRHNRVMELSFSVSGGRAVLRFTPPADVEAVADRGGLMLKVFPALSPQNSLISVLLASSSKVDQFQIEKELKDIEALRDQDLPGRAIVLCREFLQKHTEVNELTARGKDLLTRLEADGKAAVDDAKAQWSQMLSEIEALNSEERETKMGQTEVALRQAASQWDGSKYGEQIEKITLDLREKRTEYNRKEIVERARAYLEPAAKYLDEKKTLSARILLDSIESQGLTELFNETLNAQYAALRKRLAELGTELEADVLLKRAEDLLRQGDREKALQLCQTIVGRFAGAPEDGSYSETALKAFQMIREIRKK